MPKRKHQGKDGLFQRPDSPYFWASFVDSSGSRIRRSTGTSDRQEAEAVLAKWRLEVHEEKQWGKEPSRSFEQVMVEYLNEVKGRRSIESIRHMVRQLRQSFAGRAMESLRGKDVAAHIARRRADGVSDTSINRELEVLSAAINHCRIQLEWNLPNPTHGRMLKEPPGRVRWITRAEAARLIEEAGKLRFAYLSDLLTVALHTGMRREEMLGLEWRRVDLQAGVIRLEGKHTKAGKPRTVPLNKAARTAIVRRARFRAAHCPASPWVFCMKDGRRIREARKGFLSACKTAGIEDLRFHDLRHTCAAWLVTAGVPLSEVRDLLGHASITMTERYAHLAPHRVREAVAVLDEAPNVTRFGHVGDLTG